MKGGGGRGGRGGRGATSRHSASSHYSLVPHTNNDYISKTNHSLIEQCLMSCGR